MARSKRTRRSPRRVRNRGSFLKGMFLRPSRTPTSIQPVPWNRISLTFRLQGNARVGEVIISIQDLAVRLTQQLGIDTETTYHLRFINCRVWEMSGRSVLLALLNVFEPPETTVNTEEIVVAESSPGRNQWSSVGCEWPLSNQSYVFSSTTDATKPICYIITNETDQKQDFNVFMKIGLYWKTTMVHYPQLWERIRETAKKSGCTILPKASCKIAQF